MRNIFLLLGRYSTFFLFLILQIFCISIIFRFNKHHNAVGLTLANNISGKLNEQNTKVANFFTLRQTADSIAKRNAELLNGMPGNQTVFDSTIREIADYVVLDTLGNTQKTVHFIYRPSHIISKTENDDKKLYFTLARGKAAGVGVDMAVIGAETNSVIGKTIYADAKYAVVMTLLHKKSKVPAKIGRGGDNGIVEWNGKSNQYVNMPNISKAVTIKRGDSILTSSNSDIFPENLLIGVVDTFFVDKASGYYDIKIKTAANFSTTNYVQVVENVQQKETREVLKKAKKELNDL